MKSNDNKFSKKIDSLLTECGETFSSFSRTMGVTPQATSKKVKNQTWNAIDLLVVAEMTDTKLAFIDNDNKPLKVFDLSDLNKGEKHDK